MTKLQQQWIDSKDVPPMTRSQAEFADFLFKNKDEIDKIGSFTGIFNSVSKFLKDNRNKENIK